MLPIHTLDHFGHQIYPTMISYFPHIRKIFYFSASIFLRKILHPPLSGGAFRDHHDDNQYDYRRRQDGYGYPRQFFHTCNPEQFGVDHYNIDVDLSTIVSRFL